MDNYIVSKDFRRTFEGLSYLWDFLGDFLWDFPHRFHRFHGLCGGVRFHSSHGTAAGQVSAGAQSSCRAVIFSKVLSTSWNILEISLKYPWITSFSRVENFYGIIMYNPEAKIVTGQIQSGLEAVLDLPTLRLALAQLLEAQSPTLYFPRTTLNI